MPGMKLVLTGGGTGGHIYPALEVGRLAGEQGAQLTYLGSKRGQEGGICAKLGIEFTSFPAEPLYSLRTPRGWKSLKHLLKARRAVIAHFRLNRPDVVFSTGGYSAGPVVSAAKKLGIPYCIHEANSIPGRSNRLYAKDASAFTCLFNKTLSVPGLSAKRVGQPIRQELRLAAQAREFGPQQTVFVFGGSQGAQYLNSVVPELSQDSRFSEVNWLHVSGPSNFDAMQARWGGQPNYIIKPFPDSESMAAAYQSASLVVSRSGGSLAEIACFGIPSVLVPLPTAADNHQWHNAKEFQDMSVATLIEQGQDRQVLTDAIFAWISDDSRSRQASTTLDEWDIADATQRIVDLLVAAAKH